MDTPFARRSLTICISVATSCSESDEVGSSIIISCAFMVSARAISMSCCVATVSDATCAVGATSTLSCASTSFVSSFIFAQSINPFFFLGSRPKNTFSATDKMCIRDRYQVQ